MSTKVSIALIVLLATLFGFNINVISANLPCSTADNIYNHCVNELPNKDGWGNSNRTHSTFVENGKLVYRVTFNGNNGDVRWQENDITVNASSYSYTTELRGSGTADMYVRATNNDGSIAWSFLGDIKLNSGWQKITKNYKPQINILKFSIFTALITNGTLDTTGTILIPTTQTNTATTTVTNWSKAGWGQNNSSLNLINVAGVDTMQTSINNYINGDRRWQHDSTPLNKSNSLSFTGIINGNGNYGIYAEINTNNVYDYKFINSGVLGASKTVTANFIADQNYTGVNIFVALESNGVLNLSNPIFKNTTVNTPTTPDNTVINSINEPYISIDFDDGWQSMYTNALPIIQQKGIKVSQAIVSEHTDTEEYLTTAQIKDLFNKGHDIVSHSVDHAFLTTLNQSKLDIELKDSATEINKITGVTPTYFVTPYCDFNNTVTIAAKKYYKFMRNCDGQYNTVSNFDPYNIHAETIRSTTSMLDFKAYIDKVKATKSWGVIFYHQVDNSGNEYSVTKEMLSAQIDYILSQGMKIKKSSEVAKIYSNY
jgi:peptidoglycan/xylan/chitin deacetylase (PgdA/CDA1 family)